MTDHGWLLLPGGLPKTQLNEGLTETRWGRCALIKEGAKYRFIALALALESIYLYRICSGNIFLQSERRICTWWHFATGMLSTYYDC